MFCRHSKFVFNGSQNDDFALYHINQFVFISESECVNCAVENKFVFISESE